jgi:hypothetical protein
MTTRPKYWLHISSTNQATSQVNTAVSPQTARNFGLVETKRGEARSGQLVEQPQGTVALLLSCRGELPLFGVKFPKEAVVGMDGRVEIGQRRCWDGQGTEVREVDFLCCAGS